MAKFFGVVGYAETVTTTPGVWEERYTELPYYGDVLEYGRRLIPGESVNDNITVSNRISILADAYANNHFFNIRYVNWAGANWKVTDVKVERPRLILTLGEVYNGHTDGTP